ncbi:MAG: hypothetical protein JW745_08680 [Sedimentisphaerales bacterium]|nr:hypothetical protein [Sedimentisphaerales bacterium]MBN2843877.1 hypothetical protein [Sedimentisphaerales bacterium]
MIRVREKIEFGDFQTPPVLARQVVASISDIHRYGRIVEPTCGVGNFLLACMDKGVDRDKLEGWEINPDYVTQANLALQCSVNAQIVSQQDIFSIDWQQVAQKYAGESVLFVGNPPWVTNARLGSMLSCNVPEKSNVNGLGGMAAKTGSSNFDVSEWILIKLLELISQTGSSIAFIIKTSVARKAFQYVAKNKLMISRIKMVNIDVGKYFGVSADACVFFASGTISSPRDYSCKVYDNFNIDSHSKKLGYYDGCVISDMAQYMEVADIGSGSEFLWRSGIKHDAASVMEFLTCDDMLRNANGEVVGVWEDYVYPMYKSSNIAKECLSEPSRYMLVTQKKIGDRTDTIADNCPACWQYLLAHAGKLDSRKSSIYKNSPRFSVFGVGEYSFSPWKIVVSGMYKNVRFHKVGTHQGKPIVLDDTCYLLGFDSEEKADFVLNMLNSDQCQKFISSIIFLDSKRPVTVSLLNRISIRAIASKFGQLHVFEQLFVGQKELEYSYV